MKKPLKSNKNLEEKVAILITLERGVTEKILEKDRKTIDERDRFLMDLWEISKIPIHSGFFSGKQNAYLTKSEVTKAILTWIKPLWKAPPESKCPLIPSTNLLAKWKDILCIILQSQLTLDQTISANGIQWVVGGTIHSEMEMILEKLNSMGREIENWKEEIEETLQQNRLKSTTGVVLDRHQILYDFLFGSGQGSSPSWRLNEIIENFMPNAEGSQNEGKSILTI
jgi:hypothetical protein